MSTDYIQNKLAGITIAAPQLERGRIQELIFLLQNVPPEIFVMSVWKCDYAACAGGHAAQHPPFMKQGLSLVERRSTRWITDQTRYEPIYVVGCRTYSGYEALLTFFGLSEGNTLQIFDPDAYPEAHPTPSDVIQRLELLLK